MRLQSPSDNIDPSDWTQIADDSKEMVISCVASSSLIDNINYDMKLVENIILCK